MATALTNAGFDDGTTTGWAFTGTPVPNVTGLNPYSSPFNLQFVGVGEVLGLNTVVGSAFEGMSLSASMQVRLSSSGASSGQVILQWMDDALNVLGTSAGNIVQKPGSRSERWVSSAVTATAPAGATKVQAGFLVVQQSGSDIRVDQLAWNHVYNKTVTLTFPTDGSNYLENDSVPFRVTIGGSATPATESVTYEAEDTTTSIVTVVGTVTEDPWALNYDTLPEGEYSVTAIATFDGGTTITSAPNIITIGPAPPEDVREFKASNSYTNLVAENFSGVAAAIPPTAVVTGCELLLDYNLVALIRSKDIDLEDVTAARFNAAFDIVQSMNFHATLLSKSGTTYTTEGTPMVQSLEVDRADYVIDEDGTSEGKRWTVLQGPDDQIIIGSDTGLFGITSIPATEFVAKSIGIRMTPNLSPKPDYADTGDACFRLNIDKMRLRIYFDAGSVEYYFASPDKTQIIKGRLAAYCIDSGDFANGDASGDLQLTPDLEIMDGTQNYIGGDWTIHAQYPPTDANQIGDVEVRTDDALLGMAYNGLPGYEEVTENRSRYVIISANFYGDESLDSMYGAHGLPRAFAYNGEFFYKICTQPDPVKDSPRHVAYHQAHLALGFKEGRVDISVVGQPYNFDGAQGASSWAVGDGVVGLLPLSGAILGVFGSKSITGISGTTVDNFATQTLSPNIGAIEYTTTDMGFPVYANAYGVYTLAQVQQYGDYMGTPLSQPVSPWLRPRLIRKKTSDKEVVVAWPVRSKNQYRLAFSDGYVMSMTLNNGQQSAPTFSFQKYFWTNGDTYSDPDLFSYPGMVPAALSSQLDDSGEERIHMAPYVELPVLPAPPIPTIDWQDFAFFLDSTFPPVLRTTQLVEEALVDIDTDDATGMNGSGYSPMPSNAGDVVTLVSANGLYTFSVNEDGTLTNVGPPAVQTDFSFFGRYSPDDALFLVGNSSAPYLELYSKSGTTLTKIAAPTGTSPGSGINGITWSADGVYAAVALNSSPGVAIYKRTGDALARLTVTPTPTTGCRGISFSNDGQVLVMGLAVAPYLRVYANNGDDTFTYLNAAVDVAPTAIPRQIAFSSKDELVAMGLDSTPFMALYSHDGLGGLTKLTNPPSPPTTGQSFGCAWSSDDDHLLITSTNTPRAHLWSHTDGVFTKLANPTNPGFVDYTAEWLRLPVPVVDITMYGTSSPGTIIPDAGAPITDELTTVGMPTGLTSVVLYLDITHPYRGDLIVDLESPDGQTASVLVQSGSNAANIDRNFFVDFPTPVTSNGVWTLTVQDAEAPDEGTLNTWSIGNRTVGD